jgi:hypothetical protein
VVGTYFEPKSEPSFSSRNSRWSSSTAVLACFDHGTSAGVSNFARLTAT